MTTTPETEKKQTPEELLTELAQLHIRTIVPPSPKQPAAFGWQAIAGCQAAGFARALHALMQVAPEKAAEITDWFQGPFEEGPDPEEHTDWIERTVAKDVNVLDEWIGEARRLAEEAKANTEARDKRGDAGVLLGRVDELEALVKCLASPEPCEWQGAYCRTHGWQSDTGSCPHGRVQALFTTTKEV